MRHLFSPIAFLSIPLLLSGWQQQPVALKTSTGCGLQCQHYDQDPWLGTDKLLHVAASAGITWVSCHAYRYHYHNPMDRSIYFSFSLASASGIGKELYDAKVRKAGWSWKDIAADGVGIALGYLIFTHFR